MKLKSLVFLIAFLAVGYFAFGLINTDDIKISVEAISEPKKKVSNIVTSNANDKNNYVSKPNEKQKDVTRTERKAEATEPYGIGDAEHANDLLGIDSNNNGVRDDVEEYVNETFREPQVHEAAMSYARYTQAMLSLDTSNKNEVKELLNKGAAISVCLWFRVGYFDKNKNISYADRTKLQNTPDIIIEKTMNSQERKQAARQVDLAASGMAIRVPSDERSACDELY